MNEKNIAKFSVKQIECYMRNLSISNLEKSLSVLEKDSRITVQNLKKNLEKKISDYYKEIRRIEDMYAYQIRLRDKYTAKTVLCIDEVGRGPLAGPVTVAGVVLFENPMILNVADSKKLSSKKKENIFEEVTEKKLLFDYQCQNAKTIDKINILNATMLAMKKVIKKIERYLGKNIDLVLIDGNQKIPNIENKQLAIEHGDSKIYGIALASIIAKKIRDDFMNNLDMVYPEYNLKQNKGYGTKEHIHAIKNYGTSSIHRKSFLKNIV